MPLLDHIPHGLTEIINVFGELKDIPARLVTFDLPYPLLYGTTAVHRATAHELAVPHFVGALQAVQEARLEALVLRFGGIYNNRVKRGGTKPSTHAFGIAVDLEPERYPLWSEDRFPDAVVEIFRRFGFVYGGDFEGRKDPQHFQLASGY